jgi:hypothetical protein
MRTKILVAVVVAALAAAGRADDGAKKDFLPSEDELSKHVLEVARSYPTDGTHRYFWPKGSTWTGTTRDLFYEKERVCDGDAEKRCYCCGLTFEVFFRAWEAAAKKAGKDFRIGDLDAAGVHKLRRDWFGIDENDRKTCQRALTERGLGHAVPLDRARAGDFVQLWRADKSGHSVVLLAVERDKDGAPSALRYWSTQKSTNGIGERVEKIGHTGHAVLVDEVFAVRAGRKP